MSRHDKRQPDMRQVPPKASGLVDPADTASGTRSARSDRFKSMTLWLRIASVISLLFAAGHALGGLKYWSPMGDNPVLQAMRFTHFDTMGVHRSYFDFFVGFGNLLTVGQVMQGIVLWQLGAIARINALSVRPVVVVIGLAVLAGAFLSWRFLFPVPALFSLLLLAPLVVACVVADKTVDSRSLRELTGNS